MEISSKNITGILVRNLYNDKLIKLLVDNLENKRISIIREDFESISFKSTIYEYMNYEIENKNIVLKNDLKKINDSLKIVGLNKLSLDRNINTLSESEKKLLQLAIALLSNPEILIFEEPFNKLDLKNEKKLVLLLRKIKEKYDKTIIFISSNSNLLYKYTDYLIVYDDKLLREGKTSTILEDVEFLKRNSLSVPEIVEFTYLAKKKYNVKIDYHSDIRDIIKDIYKHV